jgi:hypothetical protein
MTAQTRRLWDIGRYGSPMGRFKLQFDVREVKAYASRYAYEDDSVVLAIGRTARKRGYYNREEFVAVCR